MKGVKTARSDDELGRVSKEGVGEHKQSIWSRCGQMMKILK